MTLIPGDFQTLLIDAGFGVGTAGADGKWGKDSAEATKAWFRSGMDLLAGPKPDPAPAPTPGPAPAPGAIVPADWMPRAPIKRIIAHWTAGAHKASALDREHYHIIVEADGRLVRGDPTIADNVNTSDGDYAAHTRGCNTGSIGVSVACMAGAIERPFKAGPYPMTEIQWRTMAKVCAELCEAYGITVTDKTVLGHGEVQRILGIAQAGKWDPMVLPWNPTLASAAVGNLFRDEVRRNLT